MIQSVLCGGESIETDLSVFLNSSESSYDVYIGVALLERVSVEREDLQHKMLVGRLWNAGAKLCALHKAFGHDNRTIKKWGDALKSGDLELMAQAFAGRSLRKKTTPELIRYVRQLYASRGELGRSYREVIILKTEEVFGVRISPSLASELFRGAEAPCADEEIRETPGHSSVSPCSDTAVSVQVSPTFPLMNAGASAAAGSRTLIQHAGLILFGVWLRLYSPLARQIICQILQGAVNIEQSKSVCLHSMGYFCAGLIPGLREQRQALDAQDALEETLELYAQNSRLLADGPNKGDVFYFDPHTKEYTGQLKVMKGWCGRRHGISKVVNLDCFHTRSGRPCFIQHYSPYYDMRERFFMSLSLFDRLFDTDKQRGRTFVIDRGIYGLDTLRQFGKDYVITWEKGFKGESWDTDKDSITFVRYRQKNSRSDRHSYTFECQEEAWSRDSGFRRIIVKAGRDNGKPITVSILCSHPEMDVQDIVWLIFNRWLQENDFKYLDLYFGINQLDSRGFCSFSSQADSYKDRPVDSPEYKELKAKFASAEDRLAKHLLKLRKAENKQTQLTLQKSRVIARTVKLQDSLEKKLDYLLHDGPRPRGLGALSRKFKQNQTEGCRIVRSLKDAEEKIKDLKEGITSLEDAAEEISVLLTNAVRKESRIELLVGGTYQLLNLQRKARLDALRVNAANLFRNLHDPYRVIRDNYRDDHVQLRMLTRCSGFVVRRYDAVQVSLWLPGSLQPHVIRDMQQFICGIQAQINDAAAPSELPLRIELITGPVCS